MTVSEPPSASSEMAVLPFRIFRKDSSHELWVLTTRPHGPSASSWRHQALRRPQCFRES